VPREIHKTGWQNDKPSSGGTLEQRFWIALTASLMAAAFTSAGIYTIRRFEEWAQRNSSYFVCFAAGVLIGASFLHIIPKSIQMNSQSPIYLLLGYVGLHVFNRFVTAYVCERRPDVSCPLGVVALVGIGFHSLIDGVIYSVTYTVSVFTGVLATTGMVFHEFPEGIITYLLLLRSNFSHRNALLLAFLAAGLSTPLGMLVSYPFIAHISPPLLGALLSFSAGALVYVGATHLLPQAEQEAKRYSLVALAGGILVAVVMVLAGA
jgi:zinc and cadmium transporter